MLATDMKSVYLHRHTLWTIPRPYLEPALTILVVKRKEILSMFIMSLFGVVTSNEVFLTESFDEETIWVDMTLVEGCVVEL